MLYGFALSRARLHSTPAFSEWGSAEPAGSSHGSSWGVSLVRLPTARSHEVSFCKCDIPQAVPAKGCLVIILEADTCLVVGFLLIVTLGINIWEASISSVMLRDIQSSDVFQYFTGKKCLIPNNLVLFGLLCGVLKCQESRVLVATWWSSFLDGSPC